MNAAPETEFPASLRYQTSLATNQIHSRMPNTAARAYLLKRLNTGLRRGNRFRRLKRKAWLLRKCRKLKRRASRLRATGSNCSSLTINNFTRGSVVIQPNRSITITLPSEMDFEENYENTCSHLQLLRSAVARRVRIRSLDFSELRRISTSAALALASEVDQWNQRCPRKLRAAVHTWHPDIRKLLQEMGYFELLGLKRPEGVEPDTDTTFLRFSRGETGPDVDGGPIAVALRTDIEKVAEKSIRKPQLFGGLSEAITNVGHHAYAPKDLSLRKQWWVSASYKRTPHELKVTFYDHGRGIPVTLPAWKHFSRIREIFWKMTNSQKISSAVKLGKSSTGADERGQGLQNLLEFSRAYENGKLTVYSLKGKYQSTHASGQDIEGEFEDRQNSIGGTLIEWSVLINQ